MGGEAAPRQHDPSSCRAHCSGGGGGLGASWSAALQAGLQYARLRTRLSAVATGDLGACHNGKFLSAEQKAELERIAQLIGTPGKGITACDEGVPAQLWALLRRCNFAFPTNVTEVCFMVGCFSFGKLHHRKWLLVEYSKAINFPKADLGMSPPRRCKDLRPQN